MTDIDVIVLDLDGQERLPSCLASLAQQTLRPRQILVFDNGSRIPVSERLVASESLRILRSETNLGFAGGVNEAMQYVEAPFVALVNNDVALDRHWMETVAAAMERQDRLAAVQTVLRSTMSTLDGAGIDIGDGTFRQLGYGTPLDRLATLPKAWGVSATAALYRVAALQAASVTGLVFHPAFFAYYEDVELNARLLEHGFETAVLPLILGSHAGSATGGALGPEGLRLRVRNRYFVQRLHPAIGRKHALLLEDLKRLARAGTSGDLRMIAAGVLRGLLQPITTN